MPSDLSSIIKNELVSTLESLLSATCSVDDVELKNKNDLENTQCIKVSADFSFSNSTSKWSYFVPASTATKFEYLMLGGIADLKENIDDEISDAVKEIISTISGSVTTSTNAQGFDDITGMKFTLGDNSVVQCADQSDIEKIYKFNMKLNDDSLFIYIHFDDVFLPYIENLTGNVESSISEPNISENVPVSNPNSILASILGEDSIDNLRLLFDIKLRLSVRLGTKVCLLRDVISWDIGEIIELTQMINEPLDILVNGVVIGQGEAVIVDGKFGVKIKHIGDPKLN